MGKRMSAVKCEVINLPKDADGLLALSVRIWQLHDAAIEQHINALPLDYASKRQLADLIEQSRNNRAN